MQINWCGDGVPEARKGLFYSHSTAVANFLKGSHVVISARNEVRPQPPPVITHDLTHHTQQSDVAPALIMSRVEAASGAKYSAHKEAPRRFEPIAPVGTNYVHVGRPDIDSLRRVPPAPSSAPSAPAAARSPPPPSAPRPTAAASGFGRAPAASARVAAPEDAWDAPVVSKAPPPPAATRPPVVTASRPTPVRSHVVTS